VYPQASANNYAPVLKDHLSSLLENWRPIANISTLSRIYEYLFSVRLQNYLFKYNLLAKEQFGFVKKRNITDAMVDYVTKVINCLNEKCNAVGVFLDIHEIFDCLNHNITIR
jgi:hypothetical protein